MNTPSFHRRGTLLIIVAGLSAMLATISAAYLSSLRSRTRENDRNYVDAQARILAYSAAAFIAEKKGIFAGTEYIFPIFSLDRVGSPTVSRVAENCPTDTWIRIKPSGVGTVFNVTVGVGLTRGISDYGTDEGNVPTVAAEALGKPASADLASLERSEYREYYTMQWTGSAVNQITRISNKSGATW